MRIISGLGLASSLTKNGVELGFGWSSESERDTVGFF